MGSHRRPGRGAAGPGGHPGPTYLLEAHPDFRPERLGAVRVDHDAAILGTYFKRYSCCRWIHPVIDGLSAIRARRKLRIDTVEQIEILTFGRSLTLSNVVRPQTTEEAHYSFPFCAALSLVRGPSALLPISASSLHDAQVIELADRVVVRADPDLERLFPANTPAIVRVYDGDEVHEKRMDTARGDPGLPFRPQTLRAKHRRLLSHLPNGATAVADALNTAARPTSVLSQPRSAPPSTTTKACRVGTFIEAVSSADSDWPKRS